MRRFYRESRNKKIGGVCGGLGRAFKLDANFLRLGFVFLAVLTGVLPFLIAYLVLYFVMPKDISAAYIKNPAKQLFRSKRARKISGVCGGLSEYFKCDVTLMRLIMIGLGIVTGVLPLVITYAVASYVVPERV